jgi:hypothetical protein
MSAWTRCGFSPKGSVPHRLHCTSSPVCLCLLPRLPACLSCLQFQTSVQALLISNPELADNPTLAPGAIVKLPPA